MTTAIETRATVPPPSQPERPRGQHVVRNYGGFATTLGYEPARDSSTAIAKGVADAVERLDKVDAAISAIRNDMRMSPAGRAERMQQIVVPALQEALTYIKVKRGLALMEIGQLQQREADVFTPPPTVDPVAELRDQETRGWYDTLDNVTRAKLGDQMLKDGLVGPTAGITLALSRAPYPGPAREAGVLAYREAMRKVAAESLAKIEAERADVEWALPIFDQMVAILGRAEVRSLEVA